MEMVYLHERQEQDAFAERAAKSFALNPEYRTFTDGDIAPGELFALRFGLGNDCVVVFRIGEDMPVNYQNLIECDS